MLLLWQNSAAELFMAKLKKHGLKLSPPAVPIKGQVARNIRLGSPGRTSLARIQFLAGTKPASSTCATTPLIWQDGQPVLLIVGVDPIEPEILAAASGTDDISESAAEADVMADEFATETPVSEAESLTEIAPVLPSQDDIAAWEDAAEAPVAELPKPVEPPELTVDESIVAEESAYARELDSWLEADRDGRPVLSVVPEDHEGVDEADAPTPEVGAHEESIEAPIADVQPDEAAAPVSRLSQLVDRLAGNDALFTPLTDADDMITAEPSASEDGSLFTVTGRGFVADEDVEPVEQSEAETDQDNLALLDGDTEIEPPEPATEDETPADNTPLEATLTDIAPSATPDPEVVERVSRYNFDELSRILNDRVGEANPANLPKVAEPQRSAALINLGGETLVLNRLPLGILVFRDQQVLFANRAVTEMVGYDSVERLREAGLAAVFPAAGPDGQGAGPVNHLVQRDGTLVPVTARLQSISWQGRPALMLSASATEVRTGHEAAVNAFARTLADLRHDGFFEATRTGVISSISQKAATLLGEDAALEGKPLTALIGSGDVANLREFLERPARFAETSRPSLILRSASGKAEIALFAQGQAGVITGYFGFVRGRDAAPARISAQSDVDPALLGRISRGVRRPLNTIIGFSELLQSPPTGQSDSERYEGYARDISAAGQEIAALVDELDDYARLRDGRYLPQRASIELTSLLETCVVRIRQQASSARVFVRNAISESLPRVTADRASLAQAVLNLLASAIDQTPTGGAVVISAQHGDDGSIAVHVRDSSVNAVDMAERFVVFRDGIGKDGQMLVPVKSSVGLALTRSLLAVNAFSLSVDPAGEQGMLFTMIIPADLVEKSATPNVAE